MCYISICCQPSYTSRCYTVLTSWIVSEQLLCLKNFQGQVKLRWLIKTIFVTCDDVIDIMWLAKFYPYHTLQRGILLTNMIFLSIYLSYQTHAECICFIWIFTDGLVEGWNHWKFTASLRKVPLISHLDYYSSALSCLPESTLQPLRRVMRNAAR